MTSDGRNTKQELIESISELYGFKEELIDKPEQCGLWHVRFVVNKIKYYGAIPYHGALPTLRVEGYFSKHSWKGTPIEEWYYEEFIKGKSIKIIRCVDKDSGDWEDTGIRCDSEKDAKEKISQLDNQNEYWYDIE